jgi:hypothetical protein
VDPQWLQFGSGSSFFFLNADSEPDPESQTNAEALKSQKNTATKVHSLFERQETMLIN